PGEARARRARADRGRAALDGRRTGRPAPAPRRRPGTGRGRGLDRSGANPEAGPVVRRGQPDARPAAYHGARGPRGGGAAAVLARRGSNGPGIRKHEVSMNTIAGGARQGILSLALKDKAQLYGAYMPYLKHGGI